jgi:hypothetical protein
MSESNVKAASETIDGVKVDYYVDDGGSFSAYLDSVDFGVSTLGLKALKEQVRAYIKGRTEPIEATIMDSGYGYRGDSHEKLQFRQVLVTGRHAGNGNALIRSRGEKGSTQFTSYSANLLRRLTDEEIAKCRALHRATEAAQKEWDTYRESLKLDVDKALAAQAKAKKP